MSFTRNHSEGSAFGGLQYVRQIGASAPNFNGQRVKIAKPICQNDGNNFDLAQLNVGVASVK
jgi:hypothetical protein